LSDTLIRPPRVSTGLAERGPAVAAPRVRQGDSFVPLRRDEIIELLVRLGKLDDRAETQFRRLCWLIEAAFHQEFHLRQEQLKRLYAPFDPDSDSRPVAIVGSASRGELLDEFLFGFVHVLEAANFRPLTEQELEAALADSTFWGLDLTINRDIFDRMMIFVRGEGIITRVRFELRAVFHRMVSIVRSKGILALLLADLMALFRSRDVEIEVHDRIVLAVKLRSKGQATEFIDTDNVYLKMFREIPKLDIEMLLPGTRPKMRWIDTTKIGGSSVTGLYGLFKLFMTTIFGKFTWAMIVIGAFSYALQTFFGYKRTKANYQFCMTQQLYYQNLDNNVGVFCRVIDEAEDEETKEVMLAFFFLWNRPAEAWTPDALSVAVQDLLRERTGDACQFQARDAIAKLQRLGLMRADSDSMQVIDIDAACTRLAARAAEFVERGGQ